METGGREVAKGDGNVGAPISSSSPLAPSCRPRPRQQQDLPRALEPLNTKLRVLRGCRGVNKTHWSLVPAKEGGGRGEGGGGTESSPSSPRRLSPLVLFFGGDSIDAADAHEDVTRLQTPQAQAAACFSRFEGSATGEREDEGGGGRESGSPSSPQVVVVVPSRHEAGWACFDHFLNGLTRSGEPAPPLCYSALPGLPALSQAATLLRDGGWPFAPSSSPDRRHPIEDDGTTMDVDELKRRKAEVLLGGGRGVCPPSSSTSPSPPWPPTKVVAFSKGGVVANQVLFELSALGRAGFRRGRREGDGDEEGRRRGNVAAVEKLLLSAAPDATAAAPGSSVPLLPLNTVAPHALKRPQPPPSSLAPLVAALASSIDCVSLVDAGLNCRGAYPLTDPESARGIALLDDAGEASKRLRVELVGTPRQWSDRARPFLKEERDRMLSALERAGVDARMVRVLEGRRGDLRTHFLSIEAFAETKGGGGGGGGGRTNDARN